MSAKVITNVSGVTRDPFFHTSQVNGVPYVKQIVTLCAPLNRELAVNILSSKEDFLLQPDATGLHAQTVMHAEEKLFSFYHEIACLADGRQMILPMPFSNAEPFFNSQAPVFAHDFFREFLHAALRTSAFGRVALLCPQIGSCKDIAFVRQVLQDAMASLLYRGHPFDEMAELGIRIGTPAAALLSRALAEEVDFLDLDLDSLAAHAMGAAHITPALIDQNTEAVLRLVEIAVGNAHLVGRFISISGQLANRADFLPHLLAIGADAIVRSPRSGAHQTKVAP